MSISSLSLQNAIGNDAYQRSVLFDKMKKNPAPPGEEEGKQGADILLNAEMPELTLPEKPKPNTIPFKPGHQFEYGHDSAEGKVTVTISQKSAVKVEVPGSDEPAQDRRKIVRSIVMLGLKTVDLKDFNDFLASPEGNSDKVKGELSGMGLKTALPFGLGEDSYYFTDKGTLKEYRPLDVKG